MSVLGNFIKQPAEKESYSIEFVDDLEGNDTIATVVATVTPLDLTVISSLVIGTRIKVLISGGTDGVKYKVTVTANTNDGRIMQDEFYIKVKDL